MCDKIMTHKPTLQYFILFAFVLLGCRFADELLQGTAGDVGQYGVARETAVFLLDSQPRTLDPALTYEGPGGVIGQLYSGLVRLDTDLQLQPEMAAGWAVSDDGLTYTFYLRPNVPFHNGRLLTASDVVYSWERAADPATGSDTVLTYMGDIAGLAEKRAGEAETIVGLTAVDDHTLQVTLTAPSYTFLPKLAFPVAYVVDRETVDQPDWERQPNGTGPFKLSVWQDDELLILERNDNYYLEPANIEHLVLNLGAGLPLSLYEQGEIDLVGVGGGNLERAQNPNDPLAADLRTGVSFCTSFVGLNSSQPPFDDVRVRQAFNYALDKERLIGTFWDGNALPAGGILPPGMPGYTGQMAGYPFNPDRARQLLVEAGYEMDENGRFPTFPTLTYRTAGYGDADGFVTALIILWQEVLGVTIEPVIVDPFVYRDELYAGEVGNIFDSGWCADYPDPENFLDLLFYSQSPENLGRFANGEIDQALAMARREMNQTARLEQYAAIEQKIVDEAPVVLLAHDLTAVLVSPRLQNFILTPIGVPQWHRVWLQ